MNFFPRRFINRLVDASQSIASNLYSGAQRVASVAIPQSVRRRVTNFTNWMTGNVPEEQIPQVINEVLENVEEDLPRREMPNFVLRQEASALREFATQHVIDGVRGWGANDFLEVCRESITNFFRNNRDTKVKLELVCLFSRIKSDGDIEYRQAKLSSITETITRERDVNEAYDDMVERIMENFASFVQSGSGWKFERVISLTLHAVENRPLWEGLAGSWMPLPAGLKRANNRNGLVNIKNEDDHNCFLYCCMRVVYPKKENPQIVDKKLKEQIKELNMGGIECPVKLCDINKFENQNPDFSIVVIGYDEKDGLYPLRRQRKETFDRKHLVILLLIKDEDENSHYVWVKNPSALLASKISKDKHKLSFCWSCLGHFTSERVLEDHRVFCYEEDAVRIKMPSKKQCTVMFKNWVKTQWHPFVVYGDFETMLVPIQHTKPDPSKSSTTKTHMHEPTGYAFFLKSFDENVFKSRLLLYRGEKAEEKFVEEIESLTKEIFKLPKKKMIFEPEDVKKFNKADTCYLCNIKFGEEEKRDEEDESDEEDGVEKEEEKEEKKEKDEDRWKKVRDHCHFSGIYRGAAHNKCNLKFNKPNFLPVFFHNLSGYDTHLFVKNLGVSEGEINVIPNNEEKYISFTKKTLVGQYKSKDIYKDIRFLDSFKFMSSSLAKLTENLKDYQFKNLKSEFPKEEEFKLLRRKGVYPYEYIDSLERLNETQLPPIEAFYSKLDGKGIKEEDYEHAKKVWKTFKIKTLGEYHDLYLKTDVLLLADVFESFREVCFNVYKLDPAWYFTAPGLAWDAALKLTGVKLQLIRDENKIQFIERGIRGGISMIVKRHIKANNKYLGKKYNSNMPSVFCKYLDANNLYGWAMSQKLPIGGFKWMTEKELNNWERHPCFLEVDLDVPKELHDYFNELPLAAERKKVNKVEKLIPNLHDKKKYIIHYKSLKQCLSLGLKLRKIHRGIKFKESDWLKQYIDLNTQLRTKAKNDFEKEFYKLMNNAVFGKTMENIRKRVNVRLVRSRKTARRFVNKPNFKHLEIFNENLISIHMGKTQITFNKPIYLGFSILELSKTLMYDFHYNYIKAKYGDRATLGLTDTDSLLYEIKTEDFYKDISDDVKEKFDTSDYPKEGHPSGIPVGINKKVIGMFKDETSGREIEETIGLKPKMYSIKIYDEEYCVECGKITSTIKNSRTCDECERVNKNENRKCKGIKKNIIKKTITHQDYLNCLEKNNIQHRTMTNLRSYKHQIYTEEINKIALSANDDKRFILPDRIHTLAWGHHRIEEYKK